MAFAPAGERAIVKDGKYKGAHWETRREILRILKTGGELPSSGLARELGISSMAVRQHLRALEEAGDVAATDVSRGKGRPTKYWSLTAKANRHFSDRHRELVLELLEEMQEMMGPEGMDSLLRRRGEEQVSAYRDRIDPDLSLAGKVEALARIRSDEGYMAEIELESENVCYLVENHCPICAAAERCSGLCATELAVFQATLGSLARVERVEHLMKDSRRCVYRITSI